MGYRVVVVGATGNVGREMLNILGERQFPIDEIAAVASSRSAGTQVDFGDTGEMLKIRNIEHFDFSGWDIALFAAGSAVSKIYAPKAAAAGCTVIDNSSLFRMDPDVPLIVPEVNAHAIEGYRRKNIIANPNCSTAQMVVALKPLHDFAKIKRVVVATYQSVSGAGKAGHGRAVRAEPQHLRRRPIRAAQVHQADRVQRNPAHRQLPRRRIDQGRMEDGGRDQEDPRSKIKVTATCVRVPVFVGHSEAINIEFENEISAQQAQEILRESPGIMLVDKREDGGYVTPVECVGDYATYVSRVREDSTVDNGLSLWCVSDNLRKGAALNAVQIAELLGRKHLQKAA